MTQRARSAIAALILLTAFVGGSVPTPTAAEEPGTTVIGQTLDGRDIEVGCIGHGERTALLVGGLHTGFESITATLALRVAMGLWTGEIALPQGVRVCMIPTLNLDGLERGLHTNARGVDLNRNWPTDDWVQDAWHPETGSVSGGTRPLSEPETRALYDYVESTRPDVVLVWHCCAGLVEANSVGEAPSLSMEYGKAADYWYLDVWRFYTITGEFIVAMDDLGIPAFDVELYEPNDMDLTRNVAGLLAMLEYLAGTAPVAKDVDPDPPHAGLYQVRAGDSLLSIALKFDVTEQALRTANNITAPEHFKVGRVLAIPKPD